MLATFTPFIYNGYMRVYGLLLLFFMTAHCMVFAEHNHVLIAEKNAPAVVAINVVKQDGSTFTGTGFVITPDGLIATNRHVTNQSLFINVTFNNGIVSGEAVPVAHLEEVDLALLKINAKNLTYVTLGDSDTVRPGQEITVIGNPRRLQNTISSGLISQVRKKANGIIWHQISAPISQSSSGSPVFNDAGEVISIAFASYEGEGSQNLNFSVPVNYLKLLVGQNGYTLPTQESTDTQAPASQNENAFFKHIEKSWAILKRLFSSDNSAQKTLENPA